MGSWTTGALGAAGLLGDLAGTVGSLVIGAENTAVNQQLAQLQTQALQLNLQLQKEALQQQKDWNDPGVRYQMALDAGFDPTSARQLAGAGFLHLSGGVAMQPIKSAEAINLRYSNMAHTGLTAGRAFTEGVGRAVRPMDYYNSAWLHQSGQDAFSGGTWTPLSGRSRSPSTASTIPAGGLHWGSVSTRSTQPSIPSWANMSMVSTPPSSLKIVPGTTWTPTKTPKTRMSVQGLFPSTSL